MRFNGNFSIGAKDIDGFEELFMNILDEDFDGLRENVAVGGCYGAVVVRGETGDAGAPFDLFELAQIRSQSVYFWKKLGLGLKSLYHARRCSK